MGLLMGGDLYYRSPKLLGWNKQVLRVPVQVSGVGG